MGSHPLSVSTIKILHPVVEVKSGEGTDYPPTMLHFLLWVLAVILVIYGIVVIARRDNIILGIVLIILGLLVGPGGVSIFD